MPPLQIYDRRERMLVGLTDRALALTVGVARPFRRRTQADSPERILLLRMERIGDLLMALPAIRDVRAACPAARIDLVVGSWNAALASAIRGVDRVITLDASWLARDQTGASFPSLLRAARGWRGGRYDLGINFEPDIRSNLLLAAAGARWTAGYSTGGGGPLLDQALEYRPHEHTSANARRLVATVLGAGSREATGPALSLPREAAEAAGRILGAARRPLVGIHASGGRAIKQWPPDRFAAAARRLIDGTGATVVLTGSPADRAQVDEVRQRLPREHTIDASAAGDLLTVAALLERLDIFITGDTGPMHLAGAVGTPIVAVFGPSDPARYAPGGPHDRVVRVDLPCAPCNRIRLPPERCIGHTPDCLALVTAEQVAEAARQVLAAAGHGSLARRSGAQ